MMFIRWCSQDFKSISVKPILTKLRPRIKETVYTMEGSTINIPFLRATYLRTIVSYNGNTIFSDAHFGGVKRKKYDVVLRSHFQIINVTGSDAGNYRLGGQAHKSKKRANHYK